MVGHAPPIVKSAVSSGRVAGSLRGAGPDLGGRAADADQRPGIMMCAEEVPTSMTHEPARV